MIRLRHEVPRAADRLVEARPTPAEAPPAAVAVERRIAAEAAEAVVPTAVEVGAQVEAPIAAAVAAEAAAISK
jgi:hypothetical protein